MPPPARRAVHDVREQREVREAHGVLDPAPLDDQVGDQQERDEDERRERDGSSEVIAASFRSRGSATSVLSQSPAVETRHVRRRRRALNVCASSSRSAAAARRTARACACRACRPAAAAASPGRRSRSSPTSGSSCSRGSRISTATTSWRAASRSSGCRQSSGPRKSETATTSERRRTSRAARSQARRTTWARPARRPARCGARGAARAGRAGPAGRADERRVVAERRDARGGCRAGSPRADCERDAFGDVPLAPVGRPERHRRRRVEHRATCATDRSATCARTCGSPVRAVTFQSILRTSSPTSYGRTWASSVPSPSIDARWSPSRIPSTRRRTSGRACGGARRAAGPGPGGPASARGEELDDAHDATSWRTKSCSGTGTAASTRSSTASGDDVVRDRLVAEHEPVAEHVLHQLAHVLRDHVVAAAQQRERAGGEREVDRPARADAVLDVRRRARRGRALRCGASRRRATARSGRAPDRRTRRGPPPGARASSSSESVSSTSTAPASARSMTTYSSSGAGSRRAP